MHAPRHEVTYLDNNAPRASRRRCRGMVPFLTSIMESLQRLQLRQAGGAFKGREKVAGWSVRRRRKSFSPVAARKDNARSVSLQTTGKKHIVTTQVEHRHHQPDRMLEKNGTRHPPGLRRRHALARRRGKAIRDDTPSCRSCGEQRDRVVFPVEKCFPVQEKGIFSIPTRPDAR